MRDITWITGFPRSGTNWLAQIFASSPAVRLKLCPLFSYEFKNAMDENSSPEEWAAFFPKVYNTSGEYLDQVFLKRQGAVPDFEDKEKTPAHLVIKSVRYHHLTASILEKHAGVRFVAIVRPPCATLHSWLTNPLEFPESADPAYEWRSGSCRKTGVGEYWGFEDWKAVTTQHLTFANLYPERFFLLRYEHLVQDSFTITRNLFERLGIAYTAQTSSFLTQSQSTHSSNVRSVYKNKNVLTRWALEMDKSIASSIFKELDGTSLSQFVEG